MHGGEGTGRPVATPEISLRVGATAAAVAVAVWLASLVSRVDHFDVQVQDKRSRKAHGGGGGGGAHSQNGKRRGAASVTWLADTLNPIP